MLSLVSLHSVIKELILSKNIKRKEKFFLSDYHSESLYYQNLMNTHVATR